MSKVYEGVFSLKTGWILGVIEDHQARPLTRSELDEVIKLLKTKPGETPKEYVCRGCGKSVAFSELYKHGGIYEHSGHQDAPGEAWKLWCGPVEPVKGDDHA